ncbi:MAG: DNA polymerase III subunit gamma/tau, partial [Clostridia bacterium]|nr:DNA polymerase III subunit gamma/tau [Clostridia bacterium]
MAYLALYRRFRPQGFEGLIGQEHIVKILRNQINSGKIGHAYLFCGARGTGKTTVAKIFARAINCLHPENGSPCGKCEVCEGLKDPSNMDILEMDAASNNGVDDIREMRDKIQYPPVVGKYKVYIVDEVHMLSPAAFNALLKTLEEPPAHAVFIFATTEVHKIPQTILSRCMRFDFKLIAQKELSALLAKVFDETGKEYDAAALDAIARAGEGSARDTLSIADMCSSYSVGKLTYADVLEVLGAADKGKVLDLTEKIIAGDTGAAIEIVNDLAMLGKNMGVLASDIAATIRDLTICATAKNANDILSLPADRFERYLQVARGCDGHRLLRLIDIFTSLDNAFRYSTHPRIVLETAVIKACKPESDYDIEALLSRMVELEKSVASGNFHAEKADSKHEEA